MKLKDAIDKIEQDFGLGFLKEELDFYPSSAVEGGAVKVSLVSGGESRNERYQSLLQDTYFGMLYWESTHRGGTVTFIVPIAELEVERDWLMLMRPDATPAFGFYNAPNRKVIKLNRTVLAYDIEEEDE